MPENTEVSSNQNARKVVTLTQISARRAGCVIGNEVYIYRLRRPSAKTGEQKVRDLSRKMKFETHDKAIVALELEIEKASERRFKVDDDDNFEISPK